MASREVLSTHLSGSGIEIGPGDKPFPIVLPGTWVKLVDRLVPAENEALFPELGDTVFPEPDIVADLDTDRLTKIDSGSQDFVVASHVLEHVANPIAVLDDIHRVLRPGGIAIVILPDRTMTFDRRRPATSLEHVVDEFRDDIRSVDDAHIREFLELTAQPNEPADLSDQSIARCRSRSIHAHCWQEPEFSAVIEWSIAELQHDWLLVHAYWPSQSVAGDEFGFVLQRSPISETSEVRAQQFAQAMATRRAVALALKPTSENQIGVRAASKSLGRASRGLASAVATSIQQRSRRR